MLVSYHRVLRFFETIAFAVPDTMDCDGCFELMAEFADADSTKAALSETLERVKSHLEQCPCCAYEYEALLEGIRAAEADETAGKLHDK